MRKAIIFTLVFAAMLFAQTPPYSVMITLELEGGGIAPELTPAIHVVDISTGDEYDFDASNPMFSNNPNWYILSSGMTNFDINGNGEGYVQEAGDMLSGTFVYEDYTATLDPVAMSSAGYYYHPEVLILTGGGAAIEGLTVEAIAMDGAAKVVWNVVEKDNAGFLVNGEFVESKVVTSTEVQKYEYVVNGLENGKEATITVQARDLSGKLSEAVVVNVVPVAGATGEKPTKYELNQNFPNPFNPTTNIKFSVPEAGLVTLKLYNVMGQEVATLINSYTHPAVINYNLDASNLATGVYFYRLDVNNFTATKKLALVK